MEERDGRTPDASDVSEHLRRTENAIRDLIARELQAKFGSKWADQCGVTADRIAKWETNRESEGKKFTTGNLETRLIYFAEFFDLRTILIKHRDNVFGAILNDKKRIDVFLTVLEEFRNPQAHARGLLPYQKHLAVGICGQLRAMITSYRSKKETADDCFPRIDTAYDNHGQTRGVQTHGLKTPSLRVGDSIEIEVEASDPEDLPLEYRFALLCGSRSVFEQTWSEKSAFAIELQKDHIGKSVAIVCAIRSTREFHADGDRDDSVYFHYDVLPPR